MRYDAEVLEKLSRDRQRPITTKEGQELAAELKAVTYVECSALTQKGIKNVFDEAILAALEPPDPDPKLGVLARMGKAKYCCVIV